MKRSFVTLLCISLLMGWGCGQKSYDHEDHDRDADDSVAESGNQALYDQVMKIHDEVMPKMDDIYKLKQELKNKIAATPALAEEKKKEMEATIAKLDSADRSMMDWMHNFKPMADSVAGEEKVREYLENEMEKVKKVKEDVLEALEKAKSYSTNP